MSEQNQLGEAREIIRSLLAAVPTGRCADFHHGKKDQHGYHEPCPVVARWQAAIQRAESFLNDTKNLR